MLIGYRLDGGRSSGQLLSPNQRMPWWTRLRRGLKSLLSSSHDASKVLPTPRPQAINQVPEEHAVDNKVEDPLILISRALAEMLENQYASLNQVTQHLPHDANLLRQFEFRERKKVSLAGECLLAIHVTGHLRNVKHLDLSNNQLKVLPANLPQHLPRLQTLNLQENQLQTLPLDMTAWSKSLTLLKLDRNNFVEVPSSIGHLTSLCHLSLARNPELQALKAVHFVSLINLEILDLSHNSNLHPIPYPLIRDHPNLRSIMVDGCVRMFQVFQQRVMSVAVKSSAPTRLSWFCWQAGEPTALPAHVRSLSTQCLRCDWCRGPMMASSVVHRYRHVHRFERFVIVDYSLCCAHWNTEAEYLEALLTCQ